jgi:hypothetical protein
VATERTTREILQHAEETLFTARLGLDHLRGEDPKARIAGLRNVVVFGRAVTNVLQNLRSTEPTFDAWYQPQVELMRADPLLRYFYELRSKILKQGSVAVGSSMTFSGDPMALIQRFKPPPRAKAFFIGDNVGGSGWEVETDDGSTEKFYVTIPGDVPGMKLDMNIHLTDAPDQHKKLPAPDVCEEFLGKLSTLLSDAKTRFAKNAT